MDRFIKGRTIATTIGNTIAIPNNWALMSPRAKAELLIHEARHLEQFRDWGCGVVWIGVVVLAVLYILALPAVFTVRAHLERQAYEQSMRASYMMGNKGPEYKDSWKQFMVQVFTGRLYVWMWPFKRKVEQWVDTVWYKLKIEDKMELLEYNLWKPI